MTTGRRLAYAIFFVVVIGVGGGMMSAAMGCSAQSPNLCNSAALRWGIFVLAPVVGLLIIFAAHKFLGQGEE